MLLAILSRVNRRGVRFISSEPEPRHCGLLRSSSKAGWKRWISKPEARASDGIAAWRSSERPLGDDLPSLAEDGSRKHPRQQCGLGGWPEPHLFFVCSTGSIVMVPMLHVEHVQVDLYVQMCRRFPLNER